MLSIKFETSERGDALNWVKKEILSNDLELLSFEGYTVKGGKVTILLDRGNFECECESINAEELFDTLGRLSWFQLNAKIEFSKKLGCPYIFFCYSYINEKSQVFQLKDDEAKLIRSFSSHVDFAKWTMGYRDLVMTSSYQENGLPEIDKIFRKHSIPWPGNLDYALLKGNTPTALIEFQRTVKAKVKDHCNNTWFLPTPYRKGDVNRWLAIDIIRKQSGLPLFIIVWSASEKEIKLKLVERIVYPEDPENPKGLRYTKKEVMNIEKMIKVLKHY